MCIGGGMGMAMIVRAIWPFISIIVLGAVITGIFAPLHRFIQASGKMRASLASLVVCGLIFFILFVPTVFFVGVLSREAYDLYVAARNAVFSDRFQSLVEGSLVLEKINAVLVHFNIELTGRELYQGISEIGKYVGLFLYDQARAIASNMLAFIVNFFLMLLVIYYLLIDGSRLVDFIVDLSPHQHREGDEEILSRLRHERDHRTGPARCARRAETGSPARAVCHAN
jgi:predicted PurR-regulated permease PerM